MSTKLISLDTSTTRSGYAVFVNAKLKKYGVFDYKKEKDAVIRCENMGNAIKTLLEKEKPDIIVIEKPPYIKDPDALIKLTKIVGVAWGYALDNCEYVEYMPTQWRKLICESGEKAPRKRDDCKPWDIEKAYRLLGVDTFGDDDLADACLIGLARIREMQVIAKQSA